MIHCSDAGASVNHMLEVFAAGGTAAAVRRTKPYLDSLSELRTIWSNSIDASQTAPTSSG